MTPYPSVGSRLSRNLFVPSPVPAFPVICGPTAGGKSALAVELALALEARTGTRGEVVTADAFQVYRGLDIGTAKPTPAEQRGVRHHLIDLVEPTDRFSVDQWLALANHTIDDIRARHAVPIVVGGTHLYVKALLEGLFEGPPPDPALRERLTAMDPHARRAELERVDPDAAARIHFNDVRRTVRALEIFQQTGTPISAHQRQWDAGTARPDAQLIILDWPVEAINRRINARVKDMIQRGLLDEVRTLHAGGRLGPHAAEALGYKQLLDHLLGRVSFDNAVERIKIETRRFAKNQRTWSKRLAPTPGTRLIAGPAAADAEQIQVLVDSILG